MTNIVTDWKPYAPFFRRDEFDCSHTGKCEMRKSTMDRLLAVRKEYGRPMNINSAFRDKTHPVEINKSTTGAHPMGQAVDVLVAGGDALDLIRIALKHGFTGIGVQQKGAARFIHLDDCGDSADMPRPWIWSY